MATILDRGDERRAIQFVNVDGRRCTIGLGKCPKRDAESIRDHLEQIMASKMSGRAISAETAKWIGSAPLRLTQSLAKFGLIESKLEESKAEVAVHLAKSPRKHLLAFVENYISKRQADTKDTSRTVFNRARKHLIDFIAINRLKAGIDATAFGNFREYGQFAMKPESPFNSESKKTLAAMMQWSPSILLSVASGNGKGKHRAPRKAVFEFLAQEQSLTELTVGDGIDFRRYLLSINMAESTIRKTCAVCRQFFNDALERGLISKNPFKSKQIPVAVTANEKRFFFVSREITRKVLEACPDAQMRLVVALARFGGLRTPSETLKLRWVDVDWKAMRMTVRSPKTEHHEGKESRIVPIFPELLPYLREAFDPDCDRVLTIGTDGSTNFRTQFTRCIEKAGVKPWPKLFQNLRATRQTELEDQFPTHVVCAWLGNSPQVARKHYLHATDEHFAIAIGGGSAAPALQSDADLGSKNQHPAATQKRKTPDSKGNPSNQGSVIIQRMDDTRLELVTSTMST